MLEHQHFSYLVLHTSKMFRIGFAEVKNIKKKLCQVFFVASSRRVLMALYGGVNAFLTVHGCQVHFPH